MIFGFFLFGAFLGILFYFGYKDIKTSNDRLNRNSDNLEQIARCLTVMSLIELEGFSNEEISVD